MAGLCIAPNKAVRRDHRTDQPNLNAISICPLLWDGWAQLERFLEMLEAYGL